MIPATPVTGTADPHPLVRIQDYARITQDQAALSDPTDLAASLADAIGMVEPETRRTFQYAQYTERLYLYHDGIVYPSATPLDVSKPVVGPAGNTPPDNVGVFQGGGIWVGWYVPLPSLPIFAGVVPPQTDITYWGGWTGPDGPGPFIPPKLVRIICRVAWYILHPAALQGLPGGVKSTSVGGVSISGDLSSMVASDPQLAKDIRRFRKPQVRGWGAQVTT